jgi:predicted flap endonuclease-1-like 5' DNA nuclease
MGFLLTKILILLAVAAIGGAWFAYWWFRRHYEDVTLEFTRSRDEWTRWRRSFEQQLAARPVVDLQPLAQQLAGLDAAVRAINIPQPREVDLNPAMQRLTAIDTAVRGIESPLTRQLQLLQTSLDGIRIPDAPAPVDLAPTQARLERLEEAVRAIHVPPLQSVDLNPVLERLSAMQTRLENPPAPAAAAVPRVAIREGSKNLLSHAGLGKPDDLKQIKGVKRVLERTLHKVGVYYFWQIADWSREDVEHLDRVLPAFKGRIDRDDWVTQASELSAQPSAAKPPGQQH